MDNGVQVIAKIPNPYIPQKFFTASEVATLDFLRNELGIPVPRVFAWSSKKDQLWESNLSSWKKPLAMS